MRRYDPDELLERVEHEFRVWLDETGADSAHIEVNGIGRVQDNIAWLMRDGVKEWARIPWELGSPQGDLRRAQALPDRGAWTWCRLWMDAADGVLHQGCDWMREPIFADPDGGPPVPRDCWIELDLYPRDDEFIPDWLRTGYEAELKRQQRNARRRENYRRKREQERGD